MEKFKNLILKEDMIIHAAESYRKIAANIEVANVDGNIKTIMITSTSAGEGKTTSISNVALIMTEKEKNILLLDLDLHRPALHKRFNLSNQNGVTDLLLKKDNYKKYIYNVYPKLDIITSGFIPSNSSKIVNSTAIKELIKNLSLHYDYIFIDAPPVMVVSDPITISTYSDAVIFAIAYAQTDKELAKRSVEALRNVNANIIGVILNKTPPIKGNKYYYNYY